MGIDNVDLGQFKSKSAQQPPLDGSLMGRLDIHGVGTSVHKLASTADGTLSVALPQGQMNNAIAELTGINVIRGLGLLLSQKQKETEIRCGIVDFQANKGMRCCILRSACRPISSRPKQALRWRLGHY
jgi:hypothetical protein